MNDQLVPATQLPLHQRGAVLTPTRKSRRKDLMLRVSSDGELQTYDAFEAFVPLNLVAQ
jgi:hypothetical protein